MLDTQKIKKMHKLAVYESGEGKQHLAISNYYRSDYIGLALIKNFFLTRFFVFLKERLIKKYEGIKVIKSL